MYFGLVINKMLFQLWFSCSSKVYRISLRVESITCAVWKCTYNKKTQFQSEKIISVNTLKTVDETTNVSFELSDPQNIQGHQKSSQTKFVLHSVILSKLKFIN